MALSDRVEVRAATAADLGDLSRIMNYPPEDGAVAGVLDCESQYGVRLTAGLILRLILMITGTFRLHRGHR